MQVLSNYYYCVFPDMYSVYYTCTYSFVSLSLLSSGEGNYNAVWDNNLGLCYSLVKCPCDCRVGVVIHSSLNTPHPLLNKVYTSTLCTFCKL